MSNSITIKEVIDRVQYLYSTGVPVEDSDLLDEHVYNVILTMRARVISNKANANQFLSDVTYQTIEMNDLSDYVDKHGKRIFTYKDPYPTILTYKKGYLIENVYIEYSNISDECSYIEENYVRYINGNKYTKDEPRYYLNNSDEFKIIVNNDIALIDKIKINAIFTDTIEVVNFRDNEEFLSYEDYKFPLDNKLIQDIVVLSSDELLKYYVSINTDESSNAIDETNAG